MTESHQSCNIVAPSLCSSGHLNPQKQLNHVHSLLILPQHIFPIGKDLKNMLFSHLNYLCFTSINPVDILCSSCPTCYYSYLNIYILSLTPNFYNFSCRFSYIASQPWIVFRFFWNPLFFAQLNEIKTKNRIIIM